MAQKKKEIFYMLLTDLGIEELSKHDLTKSFSGKDGSLTCRSCAQDGSFLDAKAIKKSGDKTLAMRIKIPIGFVRCVIYSIPPSEAKTFGFAQQSEQNV